MTKDVNDNIKAALRKVLEDIAKTEEQLAGRAAKFDEKIAALKAKKVKELETLTVKLRGFQEIFVKLGSSVAFPKDIKTIRFDIGDVYMKKLPDTLDIPDENKTIEKLEEKGFGETCVKTVKTVIRKACEALDEKLQKQCGITIKKGEEKLYYSINKLKTSTGFIIPNKPK